MRHAKALLGAALAVMLILAALPQAWAVVVDPYWNTVERVCEQLKEEKGIEKCNGRVVAEYIEKQRGDRWIVPGVKYVDPDLLFLIGYYALEDKEKFKEYVEIAKQINPNDPVIYYYVARYSNDPEEAIEAYLKHIELNPDGVVLLNNPDVPEINEWKSLWQAVRYEYGTKAAEFPREIYESGKYRELKTQEDLRRIGYYEWKEKVVLPRMKPTLFGIPLPETSVPLDVLLFTLLLAAVALLIFLKVRKAVAEKSEGY